MFQEYIYNRGNPIHIMDMVIYELPEQVSTEASTGFLTWSTNVFKNFPNYTFPYYLHVHLQTTTTEEIVVNFWSLVISNITYKKFYISKHFATFSPFLVVIVYEEHTHRNRGHPKKCQMVSVFFSRMVVEWWSGWGVCTALSLFYISPSNLNTPGC